MEWSVASPSSCRSCKCVKNGGWNWRRGLDLELDLELEAQCRSSRDRIRLALVAGSPQLTPHPSPPHPSSLVTSCSFVSSSSSFLHLHVCAAVQFRRRLFFFFFLLVSCSSFPWCRVRLLPVLSFLQPPSPFAVFFLVRQAEARSSRRRLTPHPTTSASLRFVRALLRLLQFYPQPNADPFKQPHPFS